MSDVHGEVTPSHIISFAFTSSNFAYYSEIPMIVNSFGSFVFFGGNIKIFVCKVSAFLSGLRYYLFLN